jgi:PAS domain S-box-containing protein
VSVAWIFGLRRWVTAAAAVSLTVTAAALALSLLAAAGARSDRRELSQRLVPAAAAAEVLLEQYLALQTSLRDYVTSGRPAALAPFTRAAAQIGGQQARVGRLVASYPRMPGQLAAAEAANTAWLAKVAAPQLAAARRGDFARARTLQADITAIRPYSLALRARMAALEAQITWTQGQVTTRLGAAQGKLLAALTATCAVIAVIAAGGMVAVRRWLLTPFTTLRHAAQSVAGGRYETRIPAAGPTELADLGRATEQMRTRLADALAVARRAEERFRGLFESSPDATVTVAADGTLAMVNAKAERMLGYTRDELVGQPVETLVPETLRQARTEHDPGYFTDPASWPKGESLQGSIKDKAGREFPVEVSISTLPTASGTEVSVALRDVSERLAAQAEAERLRAEAERERFERRLQQTQRLESLGQLVGGVAHDFNNLVNIISGYTAFIAEHINAKVSGGDKELRPVLADIEQVRGAAERAARLTRQLLIFARRDVTQPEILDLGEVIAGIEHMLRRTLGEHIDLVISRESGLWPIKADAGQLEQVLVNLAVNARDAMAGGGKLTIDTANVTVDDSYAAARPGLATGCYVRLRVSDTGIGMDRDTLAHVFEPFYTTKPVGQGTGLGLATVHGIITQAGGHADIYSEPGHGTTVSALLPATKADTAPAAEAPAAAPSRGRGETVLLVEDEKSLWELASRILSRNGYQVCTATTPADAMRHASDLTQPIDLLLTDVIMPDMLGHELAGRIRAVRPGLPVLYMSGYAQTVLDTQGALDAGLNLLEKPFSEHALLTRVRHTIDHASPPAGPGPADP